MMVPRTPHATVSETILLINELTMQSWTDLAQPKHIQERGLANTPVLPAPNEDAIAIHPDTIALPDLEKIRARR